MGLELHAHSLLHKWGFDDMAVPTEVYETFPDSEVKHVHDVWDQALVLIVRDHLLPELERQGYRVELENWCVPNTHNVLRAKAVNGTLRKTEPDFEPEPTPWHLLPPLVVEVDWDTVWGYVRRYSGPDATCVADLLAYAEA